MPASTEVSSAPAVATDSASKTPSTPEPTRTSTGPRSHGCGCTRCALSQSASVTDVRRIRPDPALGTKRNRSGLTTGAASYPSSCITSSTVTQ